MLQLYRKHMFLFMIISDFLCDNVLRPSGTFSMVNRRQFIRSKGCRSLLQLLLDPGLERFGVRTFF